MSDAAGLLEELNDPATRADPYPLYARFRSLGPQWIEQMDAVVVPGYADCEALLRDPRLSSERWRHRNAADRRDLVLPADAPSSVLRPWFLSLDPPDHTRLRRLVSSAFTARTVASLAPSVTRLADDLLDRAAERAEFDVLADLAHPLTVMVICRLLGVPLADEPLFRQWSAQLTRMVDGMSADEDWLPGMIEMHRYVHELVAAKRRARGDDLISALIAAEDGGDQLSNDELVSTVVLLLAAGHETTVNLIAAGVLALLRDPAQLDALRADPGLAEAVVEEILRYDPPAQLTARITREALRIGDLPVPAGSFVYLLLAAAHRDPAANPSPDRFDPHRVARRHLAFGFGAHFCLGAPLARLEGRVALARFAQRVRGPVLVTDPPPYREHVNLRGPSALPVVHIGVAPGSMP